MSHPEIFDWFKDNQYNIVLSVSNKKDPIAYCINNSGDHYTVSGKTVFDALSNLKNLIEGC